MAERVFAMPDLGEGLEEGRVVEWLVREGDDVTLNQPLVEVETAKAVVEIPSPFAGRVITLHGAEGADVAVGAALVTFEIKGDTDTGSAGSVRTTPPVRRLAKELGVDLETVEGTGPGGRIVEADVRRTAGDTTSAAEGPVSPVTDVRRAIAASLERQAAIPQVTTFRTVDCGALEPFRRRLGVSPLPVVIAALCRTVGDHPLWNARWTNAGIEPRVTIDLGVATDTEAGLIVPVIRDAAGRGISDIASEIARLAEGARSGTLALEDRGVATIAVSNTGSYGSEAGTPILAPGTAVTLALGLIAPRALVVDGAVVARPAATISCTFDHRVLDGAAAGRALTDLVALLESAERLEGLPR